LIIFCASLSSGNTIAYSYIPEALIPIIREKSHKNGQIPKFAGEYILVRKG
jgi:hypothetical protein